MKWTNFGGNPFMTIESTMMITFKDREGLTTLVINGDNFVVDGEHIIIRKGNKNVALYPRDIVKSVVT
ncbi:hypothetical protein Bfsp1_4 [Cytobacillus phage Bfsp1]|nr:hypothetical protein Bfsp1_4 [Cytobacillus phage Bfsp1]